MKKQIFNKSTIRILRIGVRSLLLILTTLLFLFALLSGSETYGGGLMGVVKNSPNALPWALLFIINYVVWKWETIGGIVLILFSVAAFFFFQAYAGDFNYFVLYAICIPLFLMGTILIFCRERSKNYA